MPEIILQPQTFNLIVAPTPGVQLSPTGASLQVTTAAVAPITVTPSKPIAHLIQVGAQGPAGAPGSSSKRAFAFGDATPSVVQTLPAGTTVFTAILVIQVPFNGVGAALVLGDAMQSDRLFAAALNDPTQAAEYESSPGFTYLEATEIRLTITPGAGCTQGAGYILLEV